MKPLKNANMFYLQEEIRNIKKLLATFSNSNILAPYTEELMKLEESFLKLRCSMRHTDPLNYSPRQDSSSNQIPLAPPGNVPPPSPMPTIPPLATPTVPTEVMIPQRGFTSEELSTYFNGLDGNPSYVAFHGIVFDVSNVATWGGGTHFGLFAGTDVTPGARACGYHNPNDLMRILRPVGYLEGYDPSIVPPLPDLPVMPISPETLMPPEMFEVPDIPPMPEMPILTNVPEMPIMPMGDDIPITPITPMTPITPISGMPQATTDTTIPTTIPNRLFTLEELQKNYNGQDGRPAYIALCGIVFDVTNKPSWRTSKHFGLSAGQDLTSKLPVPHDSILRHIARVLPAVGRIR